MRKGEGGHAVCVCVCAWCVMCMMCVVCVVCVVCDVCGVCGVRCVMCDVCDVCDVCDACGRATTHIHGLRLLFGLTFKAIFLIIFRCI